MNYDVTLPAYFRKNPFIRQLADVSEPVMNSYLQGLSWLLNELEMSLNWKGSIPPMLDSMKNSFIGRVHYPHPHFMEKGAHAITLETHAPDLKKEGKLENKVRAMIWVMEKLVRIHDQLDEQLHAGFYFYILTSPARFISNSQFLWAMTILMVGLGVPKMLEYINHEIEIKRVRYDEKGREIIPEKDYSQPLAALFIGIAYTLGFAMTHMPQFYLNTVRPIYEPLAETEQRDLLIKQAGHIMCSREHDYFMQMQDEVF